VCEKLTIFP